MAILVAEHCTIELTPTERKNQGLWFYTTLSLTYHNEGQSLKFNPPSSPITLEEEEIIQFIQESKQYLEGPAPPRVTKETLKHLYWFSPRPGPFSIEFRSYDRPTYGRTTTLLFDMNLRGGEVGCIMKLRTEAAIAFINQFEQEYHNAR